MQAIGAGLRYQVYHRTTVATILRGERAGLNFELLDRVDRRQLRRLSCKVVVVVDPIHQEIVRSGALAVRRKARDITFASLLPSTSSGYLAPD
jgi:hypothetical protein